VADAELRHSGPHAAPRVDAIVAAFAHLLQVALGLEWTGRGPHVDLGWQAIPAVLGGTLAIAWASARRRGPRSASSSRADRMGTRGVGVGVCGSWRARCR